MDAAKNEFWFVAECSTANQHRKMWLIKHTTLPTHAEWMNVQTPKIEGWHSTIFFEEAGAVRAACSFNYQLHHGAGFPYYHPVKVFLDGNQWCAVHQHFINLMESPAGFGYTIEEAVADLDKPGLPPAAKPTLAEAIEGIRSDIREIMG